MMSPKRGRPKGSGELTKTLPQTRVTPEEAAWARETALELGVSLSGLLRRCLVVCMRARRAAQRDAREEP